MSLLVQPLSWRPRVSNKSLCISGVSWRGISTCSSDWKGSTMVQTSRLLPFHTRYTWRFSASIWSEASLGGLVMLHFVWLGYLSNPYPILSNRIRSVSRRFELLNTRFGSSHQLDFTFALLGVGQVVGFFELFGHRLYRCVWDIQCFMTAWQFSARCPA